MEKVLVLLTFLGSVIALVFALVTAKKVLKFEEGTPFPEVLHHLPHVAYKVDDLEKYIADADSVICGPMDTNGKGDRLAFVWKDGAVLELYQEA